MSGISIYLSTDIDADFHEKYFEVLAKKLYRHTPKCIISFVDSHKKQIKGLKPMHT